jgi:Na+/H+-dicarboxylate symporter
MMSIGKASSVGLATVVLFLGTTVVAAVWGCVSTLMFIGLYQTESFEESPPPYILLGCDNAGSYLAETSNGNVVCSSNFPKDDPNVTFVLEDIFRTFVTSSGATTELSFSDTVYRGVFQKNIPDNIIEAFGTGNFAAIIFAAILFGVAIHPAVLHGKGNLSPMMGFWNDVDSVLTLIINWIIVLTPYAVFSWIASAIGEQSNLAQMFKSIGSLIASTLLAMGLQVVIVYIGLYALITRRNPLWYLSKMIPAQTLAFASSSGASTIPTTLTCVTSTGLVNESIARFVVPAGATVNMDGGAIYIVTACVWLAILNGEEVTVTAFILLIFIATAGSIGPPVPSASLVLVITGYNTAFGNAVTPHGVGYIFAIDWLMDRFRTVMNVTGDCVVAGIVAKICPFDEALEAKPVRRNRSIYAVCDVTLPMSEEQLECTSIR